MPISEKRRAAIERLKASGHFQRAGKIGGDKTKQKTVEDPEYYSKVGTRGGVALYEKYGRDHMSKISAVTKPSRMKEASNE